MKKIAAGIVFLCLFAYAAGCKKQGNTDRIPQDGVTRMTTATPGTTAQPIRTKELPIYTISADQTELLAVTVLLTEERELNEQIVAEAVTEALADNAFYVKVNSVRQEETRVTIDFSATTPPVTSVSKNLEELILDAYAQSMVDNIADCKEVSFTVEEGAYQSAFRQFPLNSVYLSR